MAPKFTIATIFEAVDKISGPARTMEGNVKNAAGGMKKAMGALKGVLGAVAAGFTVGEVVHQISDFAERAEEIGRTSRTLGMSAEALQKLRYAAKMADVPAEALTGALRKMNVNLGELRTRQGALFSHLAKTNPALARQLYTTRDSNKAFMLLVDAINHTSNAQERAALTVAAFGKSGQEMLPFIMQGADKIGELGDEAQRLGIVMSDDAVKAGERFKDSLKRISAAGAGLRDQILGRLLEKFAPLIEGLANLVVGNKRFADAIPDVVIALGYLTAAMIAFDAAANANPVGAIVAALVALSLIALEIYLHWQQITAALKSAWNWFDKLIGNPWIRVGLSIIAEPLLIIAGVIRTIIDLINGKGVAAFKNLIDAAGPFWSIGKALTDAVGITSRDNRTIGQTGGRSALEGEGGTPMSPNTRTIQSMSTSRSVADINLNGLPPGSTVKQTGKAPGVTLNLGWAAATR